MILSAALCFAAFGTWGILDRELAENRLSSGEARKWLHVTRTLVAVLGGLAATALAFTVLAEALGPFTH